MSFREHSDLCAVYKGIPHCNCSGNERDCIHDRLKRACETCELTAVEAWLAAAVKVIEALRSVLSEEGVREHLAAYVMGVEMMNRLEAYDALKKV